MIIYQVVFIQGSYSCVDFETTDFNQACEVRDELYAQMYAGGERNFDYIIREVDSESKENDCAVLEDEDFDMVTGRY